MASACLEESELRPPRPWPSIGFNRQPSRAAKRPGAWFQNEDPLDASFGEALVHLGFLEAGGELGKIASHDAREVVGG